MQTCVGTAKLMKGQFLPPIIIHSRCGFLLEIGAGTG